MSAAALRAVAVVVEADLVDAGAKAEAEATMAAKQNDVFVVYSIHLVWMIYLE